MGDKPESAKLFDPFAAWRDMRDASMDAWSKAMIQWVNSEAYAKTTGAMLDTYLAASQPFREALQNSMVQALEHLNMPTRADVISIAERLTNVEMRLDDIEAKLDAINAKRDKSPAAAEPPKEGGRSHK